MLFAHTSVKSNWSIIPTRTFNITVAQSQNNTLSSILLRCYFWHSMAASNFWARWSGVSNLLCRHQENDPWSQETHGDLSEGQWPIQPSITVGVGCKQYSSGFPSLLFASVGVSQWQSWKKTLMFWLENCHGLVLIAVQFSCSWWVTVGHIAIQHGHN